MVKRIVIVTIVITLLMTGMVNAAPEDVDTKVQEFNLNGTIRRANVVTVDLNSKDTKLEVVTANNKIKGSENFKSMINRKKPVVAINANYFDAYKTLEPYGTIIKNNQVVHMVGSNTSFIVNDKSVDIGYTKPIIKGYLNGKRVNKWNSSTQKMDFNLFNIWYVNTAPTDKTGVYMYTPLRGKSIALGTGTVIEVMDNKVSKITKIKETSQIGIPKKGYLIYYGKDSANDEYIASRFKVGNKVELEYEMEDQKEKVTEVVKEKKELTSINTKLNGSIDKKTKNNWNNTTQKMDFNIFNVWYINNDPIDSTGVYLYTPEKGKKLEVPEGKAITVTNNLVSKVELTTKEVNIPENGFVIYYGKDAVKNNYITERFQIGKTVDFYNKDTMKIDTDNIIKTAVANNTSALKSKKVTSGEDKELSENTIKQMISAGPFLVNDSKVITDYASQGFKEAKIVTGSAQRSALGLTKDNKLVLVTGSNLTMKQLAEIMKELKCEKAMNLDGGASSGLYAKGKIITTPGRQLNTVLMVHDKTE